MKHSHTIARLGACLVMATASDMALAQRSNAEAVLGIAGGLSPTSVSDLLPEDNIPASANITTGYIYGAISSGAAPADSPLPSPVSAYRKSAAATSDTISLSGKRPEGEFGVMMSMSRISTKAPENMRATTWMGRFAEVTLAPHTSATLTTDVYLDIFVPMVENYQPPSDPSMPGVRLTALSYLGPANEAFLSSSQIGPALFDPDAQGRFCRVCDTDAANWRTTSVDPRAADYFWPGLLEINDSYSQSYTIRNDSDSEQAFQMVSFGVVMAVNTLPASPVPEPSSTALMLVGLAWTLRYARRSRLTLTPH